MRQFYLKTEPDRPPVPGEKVVLDPEESHHLATVLRGGRQELLNLVDGCGLRLTGRSCGKKGKLELVEVLSVDRDEREARPPRLVLACAVVKGKRFEWALEKAVEVGVHRVIPLATERGTIEPGSGKRDRWNTIMKSALKQSGRSWLPDLEETRSPGSVAAEPESGLVLFGAVPGEIPGAESPPRSWSCLLDEIPPGQPDSTAVPNALTLMIGPEGGWSPAERETLLLAGAIPVELGPHVLRTETAAVAGLFGLQTIRSRWLELAAGSGS